MAKQDADSLDDIIKALSVNNIDKDDQESDSEKEIEELTDEQEIAKTMKGLDELIKSNAEILEEAKQLIFSTGDVEMIEAYSSIGKSQSEAFKNKVKLLMEKQKNSITNITKHRELDIKEKVADFTIGKGDSANLPTTLNQTNVILSGTREELFEMLSKMKDKEKPVIDV